MASNDRRWLSITALLACVTWNATGQSGQHEVIVTVAGSRNAGFSGDGGPAISATLDYPTSVAVDSTGNLFIADLSNNRIRKVSTGGIITTVAGNGPSCRPSLCGGFSGDGGPATSATMNQPHVVAVDASGNLFITDSLNNRIRKVSTSGIITTYAGSGPFGIITTGPGCNPYFYCTTGSFSGDGGLATSATMNEPNGVVVNASGNLFIADTLNYRIRKVSPTGIVATVAGDGNRDFSGDGGPATAASMDIDYGGVAVDAAGNLYFSDTDNQRVRKVSPSGIITTVAGNGNPGFSGDGGPATSASLQGPFGIAVDATGNLFIADTSNNRIRKVSTSGIITTVAGSGNAGFSGDGGPATSASLDTPLGVTVDASGNLFISDSGNNRIREVQTVSALGAVQNAASYASGAVSPGEIVVLYGAGMGPASLTALQVDSASGLLETTLAGTTVLFNGTPGPIVYTSAGQVSVIVPYEIAGAATAQVLVNYQGKYVAAGTVTVAPSAPGIFTVKSGTGQAAALNQDGSVNSASNPAAAGSTIVLYLTGEGQTSPPGVDGKIAAAAPFPTPLLPVTVTIGGRTATYAYAGAAPGEVAGVMQINAIIPTGVTGNVVPISVQIGTASTQNSPTIAVQ